MDVNRQYYMTKSDTMIGNCDDAICRNLDRVETLERGLLSVNVLSQLRNLVDHISVKVYLKFGKDSVLPKKYYDLIVKGNKFVNSCGQYNIIRQFHELLQISASHYTLDEENSERLMLKYYVHLWRIRKFANEKLGISILRNLERFPLDTDQSLSQYHTAIANSIANIDLSNAQTSENRFYIYRSRPLIVGDSLLYELTLSLANERSSKFDHIIVFSDQELMPYYAFRIRLTTTEINLSGICIPITVVVDYAPSIRICEIRNLGKILGLDIPDGRTKEYQNLMAFLKENPYSLTGIVSLEDDSFNRIISYIQQGSRTRHISKLLQRCRKIVKVGRNGHNILRYLIYRINNKVIRQQYNSQRCNRLSGLYLDIRSKPFDELPFSFSLFNHNPKYSDLMESIPTTGHESEFLARRLAVNAEQCGMLYTPVKELTRFEGLQSLAKTYNDRLYHKHKHASIDFFNGYAYIQKYESNVHEILLALKRMTTRGITDYSTVAEAWMQTPSINIESAEKKNALKNIFSDSRVAFVYGAAGTGKSTFINYLSHIFSENDKLYIANTNPAVDNLRRKVNAANASFMTISSYLCRRAISCDILFVDECSTVCNEDMLAILNKRGFRLLVLVGDMYQIEAIRFGNWFSVANSCFKGNYKIELTQPYRTSDQDLLTTWDKIRKLSSDILEHIARNGYSSSLNETIFSKNENDEIILCLNYGGLYGINNINRILQRNNPHPPVQWGIHVFKIGDPILFNESDRFSPYLHNNLKGAILDIIKEDKNICFTLQIDKVIPSFDLEDTQIEFVSATADGKGTIIRIHVEEEGDNDADVDISDSIVPFQIAYAVSIHKAQGLEYQSVKIVITRDVEDMITHNIFYTAITRTKNKLVIYWSPETEKYVLEHLKPQFNKQDYGILKSRYSDLQA